MIRRRAARIRPKDEDYFHLPFAEKPSHQAQGPG